MTDPPPPGRLSLPRTVLLTTAVFAAVLPLVQWTAALVFRDPDPIPPGPVWMRFAAVLALTGACMGPAVYATASRPRGWPRSFVNGLMISLAIGADIEDFAGMPLDRFLERWMVVSLVTGLILGSVFHAFAGEDEPPPGR